MDGTLLGILPLVAGVIVLSLGIASLVQNPRLKVSRAFFASAAFAGASNVALCVLLISSDRPSEDTLSRLLLSTTILAAGANVFLASSLTVWRGTSWTRDHPAVVVLAVLAVAMAAGFSDGTVSARGLAASEVPDTAWSLPVLLGVALVGVSVWAMSSARKASTDQYFRRAAIWLGAAFVLPAVALAAVFKGDGVTASGLVASSSSVLYSAMFAYVSVRYHTFTQLPAAAKADQYSFEDSMSPGSSILVEGKSSDAAYALFLAELRRGGEGLVISRDHPGRVRERLGPENASVLWLCTQPGPGKIDPSSLSLLQSTISDFLKKDKRAVALLDGLEYLVSENRPDKVLRLVYGIKDVVTVSGSKLIVPLDPETLDTRDLAFFEREFKVLRPGSEPWNGQSAS